MPAAYQAAQQTRAASIFSIRYHGFLIFFLRLDTQLPMENHLPSNPLASNMDDYLDIERGPLRDEDRDTNSSAAIMVGPFASLNQGNCLVKSVAMLFQTIIFIVNKFASLIIFFINKLGRYHALYHLHG